MSFVGTFIIGRNDIVCWHDARVELESIPPGRYDVTEATAFTWKLVEESGQALYLSKEKYGKGLPREFVREPRVPTDLMRQIMALGGFAQEHLDAAVRLYLDRTRVLAEWAQAAHLDESGE